MFKNTNKTNNKSNAFTLAEVLITLTIIGVIAALTIPNLIQRHTEQATVTKVKKFYSTLSNAYAMAQKENGTVDEWISEFSTTNAENNAKEVYEKLFKPYFKIAKDCGVNNNGNCFKNVTYKMYRGDNWVNIATNNAWGNVYYKLQLEDGSLIAISASAVGNNNAYFNVHYDVNGQKEPNTYGKDMFVFRTYDNNTKIVPYGEIFPVQGVDNQSCSKQGTGAFCTAWLVYKGNMDYLHCSDLSWNGKNKCK